MQEWAIVDVYSLIYFELTLLSSDKHLGASAYSITTGPAAIQAEIMKVFEDIF